MLAAKTPRRQAASLRCPRRCWPTRSMPASVICAVVSVARSSCTRRCKGKGGRANRPRQQRPTNRAASAAAAAARTAASRAASNPAEQGKQSKQAKEREKLYGKEQFVWEESTRTYLCPAGQRLQRVTRARVPRVHGGSVAVEKSGTKACAGCKQRGQCTKSKPGRPIKRLVDEPLVEELRQRMRSNSGKELYRLRQADHRTRLCRCDRAPRSETALLGLRAAAGTCKSKWKLPRLALHNLKTLDQLRQTAAKHAA